MNDVILLLTLQIFYHAAQVKCELAGWGDWGYWSDCSVTCGYGTINRSRYWIDQDGEMTNFTYVSILECWTQVPCPVHGDWSMWSGWSQCTVFCGNGTKVRSRDCNSPEPSESGDECKGPGSQVWHCNDTPCPELPPDFDITQCNQSTDFMCESRLHCVPLTYRCDGELHCHDGSDEGGCYYYFFNGSLQLWAQTTQTVIAISLTIVAFTLKCL